jgi:methylmalonyl-CoA/ethylmalonyl-CoA epimerase
VAKFIEKRGEGFFLISYRVDDVDEALAELKAKGRKTIDQEPRELMGTRYAFIHPPKELCGVLTEVLDGEFEWLQEPVS